MVKLNFELAAHAEHFYHRYVTWCKAQRIDYDLEKFPVAESSKDGYPVISWWNDEAITNTESNVVFIDSTIEGYNLFEQPITRQKLSNYPSDKHYIFLNGSYFSSTDDPMPYTYDVLQVRGLLEMAHQVITSDTHTQSYVYHDIDEVRAISPVDFFTLIGKKSPERDIFVKKLKQRAKPNSYILKYDGELMSDIYSNTYLAQPFESQAINYKGQNLGVGLVRLPNLRISFSLAKQCKYALQIDTTVLNNRHRGFFSASILQSLVIHMPLLIVSAPGALQELRNLGFKTWGDFWDESYDQELDFQKRIDKIMNVVNYLADEFDWEKNSDALWEISKHNAYTIMAQGHTYKQEFLNFENLIEDLYNRKLIV